MNNYSIILGITYFNKGYFNLGVVASHIIDNHGKPLKLILMNQGEILININRTANKNQSVRLYGGKPLINFIQTNFHLNEEMYFEVINPNTIRIYKHGKNKQST